MHTFDLIVIGSGAGGQRAAIAAAKLGKSVCVIERAATVGGAMINTGTIPSKALREAILTIGGIRANSSDINQTRATLFRNILDSCQEVVRAEVATIGRHFRNNGIELIYGNASFVNSTTVAVTTADFRTQVCAPKIVIAVGSAPARPSNVEFDGHHILTSDEVLRLTSIPRSIIVVGGGVIGTEYASMLALLGVKITLIEGRPRLLEFIDSEITEALQYHLRQSGITLRLGEKVERMGLVDCTISPGSPPRCSVEATLESGKSLKADCLLYCIGPQGCIAGLGLENAGVTADNRGRIKVDVNYQTQAPGIYAVGDVIGFPALASTSMEQGRIAACHAFGQPCESFDELLPYGIYAIPEISMVGWTEERLTAAEIPYESGIARYKEIARGQLLGDEVGMLKLLIHQDSHTVLGVHAIGTNATELIHIGQTAIAFKATAEYFVNTVFNYPTLAECYKVAAMNALNKLKNV